MKRIPFTVGAILLAVATISAAPQTSNDYTFNQQTELQVESYHPSLELEGSHID